MVPDPSTSPTVRHVDCRESLPDTPTGTYVVVDVMHFSSTVIELLARGASYVHVPDERGHEFAFRAEHPTALLGGPKTEDYEPVTGYDFINSPSFVQSLPVEGRPVAFTSSNGGRSVADIRERSDGEADVFVGSTTNAAALARYLQGRDRVTVLSAGTDGDSATEDHLGAALIDRLLRGDPPSPADRRAIRAHLRVARGPDYAWKNGVRNADVTEYETALSSRPVVPRLDGDRLVDVDGVAGDGEPVGSLA